MRMRRYAVCAAVLISFFGLGCVVLPESQLPVEGRQVVALDQGWTDEEASLFWHESQGTVVVPYDWFLALQTPEVKFFGSVDYFASPEYLSRYGLLFAASHTASPSSVGSPLGACKGSDNLHCGLPIGLARAEITMAQIDPTKESEVVGFTCAACHTGELHFGDTAIRIEGATNLIDVTQFQSALGGALLLTQKLPFRFNRFAQEVLEFRGFDRTTDEGDRAFKTARQELKSQLDNFLDKSAPETMTALRKGLYRNYPGGYGRTDALARITNMVFGTKMGIDDNLVVGSAPVKFPSIWDAPYFAWAQYNGSIEQSMVRNVGEALGVRAVIEYREGEGGEWAGEGQASIESSVDLPGVFSIETLLRGTGKEYFNGLRSPIWPVEHTNMPIRWDAARRGKDLYDQHCSACHLPPLDTLVQWGPIVGDRTNRDVSGAAPDTKLVPKGEPRYLIAGDDTSPVIGLTEPTPPGEAPGPMHWISNNHPDMLGNLRASLYPDEDLEFFLNLGYVNLGTIGTDPGQAANFAKNIINTEQYLLPRFDTWGVPLDGSGNKSLQLEFPQRIMPAGVGLQMVTINIMERFYDTVDAQTPEERREFINSLPVNLLRYEDNGDLAGDEDTREAAEGLFLAERSASGVEKINRVEWNGKRPPGATVGAHYRPHPLNGIWASPPYLHNGSVPTIYQLLSPHEERDEVFYTGNRQYDAENLGYRTKRFRGGFRYDTGVTGNSNKGHEFAEKPLGNGVIGPGLSEQERREVIEFLKTLCPPGFLSDFETQVLCARLPGGNG